MACRLSFKFARNVFHKAASELVSITLQVATVLDDPGVFPTWSKQTATVVPDVHFADTPHTHVPLRHLFDKTSPPHASEVPHLHTAGDTLPSQVSVVKVQAGLQSAKTRKEYQSKFEASNMSS